MSTICNKNSVIRISLDEGHKLLVKNFIDLANETLGGRIIEVSDEFFAEARNLLKPTKSVRDASKYTERGAWYDGWETRRHNPLSHDWVIVKLGFMGKIVGFDIDTAHFNGNHAPLASVEACCSPKSDPKHGDDTEWFEILEKVALDPSSQHYFSIRESSTFTHVRLNIYPDGGVARFRVYGIVSVLWPQDPTALIDLAYLGHGAKVVACSNQHYARAENLLLPGRGIDMSDGWETRRSREKNHSDWVIIQLGAPGFLDHVEIDTAFFKGNFPESATLEACYSDPVDGGLKRLRIFGRRQLPSSTSLQSLSFKSIISPSITSQTSPEILMAQPLTYEAFAPYGHVIDSFKEPSVSPFMTSITNNLRVTPANQGTARKYNHIAPVINFRETDIISSDKGTVVQFVAKARPNLSLFRCSPMNLPISIKMLEKHSYSSQAFIPMNNGSKAKGYLVIVCLGDKDGNPNLETLRPFIAKNCQGISYNPGVWHHPMIALKETTNFVCLTHESGNQLQDCEEIDMTNHNIQVDAPSDFYKGVGDYNEIGRIVQSML
ncbi:16938_t:CDS:2 [Dentiscutata erythropus]|uniref:16938_t:CDS:1 n=1 Tax=Dentiscutata erythropus TaxID=1348616 RepID=A0A9N9HMV0_9GLOM|nr:16938_t:CDS:2 [Dentiscutata erythropus]